LCPHGARPLRRSRGGFVATHANREAEAGTWVMRCGTLASEVQGEEPWGASPQACDLITRLVKGSCLADGEGEKGAGEAGGEGAGDQGALVGVALGGNGAFAMEQIDQRGLVIGNANANAKIAAPEP